MRYVTYKILIVLIIPVYAKGMVSIGQKRWHDTPIEVPNTVIISTYLARKLFYDPKSNRFTNRTLSPLINNFHISINETFELNIPKTITNLLILRNKWGEPFYPATFYMCALFSGKTHAMQMFFDQCNGNLETLLPSDNKEPDQDSAFKQGIILYQKKPEYIPRNSSVLAMNHFANSPTSLKLKLINILI